MLESRRKEKAAGLPGRSFSVYSKPFIPLGVATVIGVKPGKAVIYYCHHDHGQIAKFRLKLFVTDSLSLLSLLTSLVRYGNLGNICI